MCVCVCENKYRSVCVREQLSSVCLFGKKRDVKGKISVCMCEKRMLVFREQLSHVFLFGGGSESINETFACVEVCASVLMRLRMYKALTE